MIYTFIVASILIELTPGPNMMWLAVLGSVRGRLPALAAVAGIALGLTLAAVVSGFGLAKLFDEIPKLFTALRGMGTLYLFYLAWDAWRDADNTVTSTSETPWQAFMQGLIGNILNPKAYLFYAAVMPQFMDPAQPKLQQIAVLSAIYIVTATTIHVEIALLSGSLTGWLQKSRQAVLIRKVLAILIAATAIWFFISTQMPK